MYRIDDSIQRLFRDRLFAEGLSNHASAGIFQKDLEASQREGGVLYLEAVGGSITRLICARKKRDTLGRWIVEFYPCFIEAAASAELKNILVDLRRKITRRPSLMVVRVDPRQKGLIRSLVDDLGFGIDANLFMRDIAAAQRSFRTGLTHVPGEYSIKILTKADLKEIQDLYVFAHRAKAMSRAHSLVKTREGAQAVRKAQRKWLRGCLAKKQVGGFCAAK